jgi:hypothetical protein
VRPSRPAPLGAGGLWRRRDAPAGRWRPRLPWSALSRGAARALVRSAAGPTSGTARRRGRDACPTPPDSARSWAARRGLRRRHRRPSGARAATRALAMPKAHGRDSPSTASALRWRGRVGAATRLPTATRPAWEGLLCATPITHCPGGRRHMVVAAVSNGARCREVRAPPPAVRTHPPRAIGTTAPDDDTADGVRGGGWALVQPSHQRPAVVAGALPPGARGRRVGSRRGGRWHANERRQTCG